MLAFKIYINNEEAAVAGVPDLGQLVALMTSGNCTDIAPEQREKELKHEGEEGCNFISVYGSPSNNRNRRLIWIDRKGLTVGDEVRICIVESDSTDAPDKEELTEPKDKLRYESVKRLYFELKEKYEES